MSVFVSESGKSNWTNWVLFSIHYMVKTYAHFCFDTLVRFKMGGRGRKLVGKEGREPAGQGKDCGRGRSAEEV